MHIFIFFLGVYIQNNAIWGSGPEPMRLSGRHQISHTVSEALSCDYGYTQNTNHLIAQKYQMQEKQFSTVSWFLAVRELSSS